MRKILICVACAAVAVTAYATEDKVKLKDGPGLAQVQANCVPCHSLDYIVMNSKFLDRKGWEATVTKMQKAFGAPVKNEDVTVIVDYLTREYGKQ